MAGISGSGTTNDTTPVEVVAAPTSGKSRLIPMGGLNVFNNDTDGNTVTVRFRTVAGGTPSYSTLEEVPMEAGESWSLDVPQVLSDTGDSLQIMVDAAVATEMDWVSHWRDETQ